MQRVSLKSFVYDPHSLRGTCWRSKTTARGQPFGLVSSGLMSEGSFTWVLKFLWTMDQILTRLHLDDLDFVLPAFRDDLLVVPLEPMSYASALQHLRKFIHDITGRQRINPCISAQLIAENWTAETFAFCVSSIEEFSPAFFSELVPGEEVGALQRAFTRSPIGADLR
ncbi:unnamed protein product, partial [Durusdinium trenchii]